MSDTVYKGTSATQVMGADSPDTAGKVYYRLTLEHVNSYLALGFDLGWAPALVNAYAALQASTMVIPISAVPVDDGSDVAVMDVVVGPQGMYGNSVGDLVALLDGVSAFANVQSVERVRLGGVDATTQAQQRQAVADAAAAKVKANSITSTISGALGGVSTDIKWVVVGLIVLVLGYVYFTKRSS